MLERLDTQRRGKLERSGYNDSSGQRKLTHLQMTNQKNLRDISRLRQTLTFLMIIKEVGISRLRAIGKIWFHLPVDYSIH